MCVLLTRSDADNARIAAQAGLDPDQVLTWPVLRVQPMDVAPPAPGTQALLFTSGNGVAAFADACERRDLPALCVGDRTADLARARGFADVRSAAGSATDLAAIALQSGFTRFVYVRGQQVSVDLAQVLRSHGLFVDECIAYAMVAMDQPPTPVAKAFDSGHVTLVTVWSAGVATVLERAIAGNSQWSLVATDMLAISSKAAAPLGKTPFRHTIVASRPDATAMVDSLCAALRQKNERGRL